MYRINNLPDFFRIQSSQEGQKITIDASPWIDAYGTSEIGIYYVAPNVENDKGKFVNTTLNDGVLQWNLSHTDISVPGRAYAVIVLNGNDRIKKSKEVCLVIK